MRPRFLFGALGAAVLWAACAEVGGQQESAGGLVQVSDSTACGVTEYVYTNHTTLAKELFVVVKNLCEIDSLAVSGPAAVRVRRRDGSADTTQQAKVAHGRTHRGTFMIPPGGHLEVECPTGYFRCCPWRYSLTIKF